MLPISLLLINKKGVPAEVIMAMAALESGNGKSQLSKNQNNYFGIKARSGQSGHTYPTKEIINGKEVTINANFAVYKSPTESAQAFVNLLNNSRYRDALKEKGTKAIIKKIVASGYATMDPETYANAAIGAFNADKQNKIKILTVAALPLLLLSLIFVLPKKG